MSFGNSDFNMIKTGYVFPTTYDRVGYHAIESNLNEKLSEELDLPEGWSISATGIAGASGYYVEFEIDHIPEAGDFECVQAELEVFNNAKKFTVVTASFIDDSKGETDLGVKSYSECEKYIEKHEDPKNEEYGYEIKEVS